ncbi:hypothetical protein ACIP98_41615 [Streptomyces sp. NPDC088354]|uniref:hypothetical protein n=1 Tax=Streptomyces sp. NPDC088354 TaxID=3365856 RepID=UPI0038104770
MEQIFQHPGLSGKQHVPSQALYLDPGYRELAGVSLDELLMDGTAWTAIERADAAALRIDAGRWGLATLRCTYRARVGAVAGPGNWAVHINGSQVGAFCQDGVMMASEGGDVLGPGGLEDAATEVREAEATVVTARRRLNFRAVATRYDKRAYTYLGTVTVAALVIWLRT